MNRGKRKIITSFDKLTADQLSALQSMYPDGFSNKIIRVDKGNNTFFNAIIFETEEAIYLVKVNSKIDVSAQNPEQIIEDYKRIKMSLMNEVKKAFKKKEISDRILGLF